MIYILSPATCVSLLSYFLYDVSGGVLRQRYQVAFFGCFVFRVFFGKDRAS